MARYLAIDFGTTNSVVAHQNGSTEVLALPGLSTPGDAAQPPLIPSLLYVVDGVTGSTIGGQAVASGGLDARPDNRLFRNFKRGLVAAPAPPPREIDGVAWDDRAASEHFLRHVLDALPYRPDELEQIVFTAPVAAFENYVAWLGGLLGDVGVRVVDESTAAALGYAVTEPGAVVLVFDFGGGTLDLSLVQLPEHRTQTGRLLSRLQRTSTPSAARVIAKTGRVLGGSDVDQWLLAEALNRTNLTPAALGSDYTALLTRCEQAKIALSMQPETALNVAGRALTITRDELENMLAHQGFFAALRHTIDKLMHVARQQGVFKEDVQAVLMVGGASLMPSVQATLANYFGETPLHMHKPFTAVAEGALQVAAGHGLDDYLVHSYGLRHLEHAGQHAYDELIPEGTRYPTSEPVEVTLAAAHPDQQEIEIVLGEIDTDAVTLVEVQYEDGQAVFVARPAESAQQIVPLNAGDPPVLRLEPTGAPGQDRLRASFTVDAQRRLRLTVTDLHTRRKLLNDAPVLTLR